MKLITKSFHNDMKKLGMYILFHIYLLNLITVSFIAISVISMAYRVL